MKKFPQHIVIERTLEIGDAKMTEGDEAYIRFQISPLVGENAAASNECWMNATLAKLSDDTAWFIFNGRKDTGLELRPKNILEITDKCPVSEPQTFLEKFLIRVENTGEMRGERQ